MTIVSTSITAPIVGVRNEETFGTVRHRALLAPPSEYIRQVGEGDCQTAIARMVIDAILSVEYYREQLDPIDRELLQRQKERTNRELRDELLQRHHHSGYHNACQSGLPICYLSHLVHPLGLDVIDHETTGYSPSASWLVEELRARRPVVIIAKLKGVKDPRPQFQNHHMLLLVGALGRSLGESFQPTHFILLDPQPNPVRIETHGRMANQWPEWLSAAGENSQSLLQKLCSRLPCGVQNNLAVWVIPRRELLEGPRSKADLTKETRETDWLLICEWTKTGFVRVAL